MDIRELQGSQIEQTSVPAEQVNVCPSCAAQIVPGDRFCQECGTRISARGSKRFSSQIETGTQSAACKATQSASIICINCGTTNKPPSTVCSDCRIPLVPPALSIDEPVNIETNGLRGSLSRRARISVHPREEKLSTDSSINTPTGTQESVRADGSVKRQGATQENVRADSLEPDATGKESHEKRTQEAQQETEKEKRKKTAKKQRLPRFVSPLSGAYFHDEGGALDFLFPMADGNKASTRVYDSFDRLIVETRNMGGVFSISKMQVAVEGLFERVPTPVMFLVLSLIIILVTVGATTKWNHYEQRLSAIDKIAANAEQNMLRFQLDEAVNTLKELERTEKGDLPPRARAVLDQSLWLRSYSYAKQRQYSKAISDLSGVTSNFVSYDDVSERLDEYKKILASHPELETGGNQQHPPQAKAAAKNRPARLEQARPLEQKKENQIGKEKQSKTAIQSQSAEQSQTVKQSQAAKQVEDLREKKHETGPFATNAKGGLATTETSSTKSETKVGSTRSQAALLDADIKRYNGLLIEYFSKIEQKPSDSSSEPPSYEEWTAGGRRDF